ncbi:UDP-N-acetylglucosamine 2-epimerase (hydrolyzing) [Chitinimonas arctica]|uniref:UDP-N-acetylglucosamine 2-epimerase (Hydrolyzing) n=1 Tax=Chitinimonas arctica TaxID=2594795 RepID=A0A516SC43_9NEIS|nr:UDP-N-acetylglucosamine 2-epimerase [Chitinimonas arctica]QDQ25717.1 UDP-N-acetylglucosamine 2-epimerase (hydrolyzing) [Chitinimonas arctica]
MRATVRRVCYLSGTRADFGLMQNALQAIAASPGLSLDIIACGMHLSPKFGMTVDEISKAGLRIVERIPLVDEAGTGVAMARNMAHTLDKCVLTLARIKPDLMLLLGDRGEMLAGALAAIHLNIPIVHIHGGERSGTVDEPVRHAISKLSHFHFVATEQAQARLVRMGEQAEAVFLTGAPGLDGLADLAAFDRSGLCHRVGFDRDRGIALLVYHPVLQQSDQASLEVKGLLDACLAHNLQLIALRPNSDAGGDEIRSVLEKYEDRADVRIFTHLPREEFVSWMAHCDVMVGNSSSGIIEAGSFGTPVMNIGARQHLRERNSNVIDVDAQECDMTAALGRILAHGPYAPRNVYDAGGAAGRMAELLSALDISPAVLRKANAY